MTTPAKKTAPKKARTQNKPSGFDFESVVVKTETGNTALRRTTLKVPEVFRREMTDSWEKRSKIGRTAGIDRYLGSTKTIVISASAKMEADRFVRRVADEMGVGSTTATKELPGGKIAFSFAAKTPKQRRKVETTTTTEPSTTTAEPSTASSNG